MCGLDLGLAGKNAIVTGASRGIGKAIALALAREGANVAICARGESSLRNAVEEIRRFNVSVHSAVCDVGAPISLQRFIDHARRELGSVDILVNNASAIARSDATEDWNSSLRVDQMAPVRSCEQAVPWMKESGGGSIPFISSISGLESWGSLPAYSAAKAALISYSKTLSISLASHGIRVNTIAPGSIEFEGGVWDEFRQRDPQAYKGIIRSIPTGRMGTPDEVANVAVFLASDRASWVTGTCIPIDGGQRKANV